MAVYHVLVLVLSSALSQPHDHPMAYQSCQADTGGTCKWVGCKSWRQATCTRDYKCECLAGTCSVDGACLDWCNKKTTGTCRIFGCKSSRGATDCIDGVCYCKPDHCMNEDGVCVEMGPDANLLMLNAVSNYGNTTELAALPETLGTQEFQRQGKLAFASFLMAFVASSIATAMIMSRGRPSEDDKFKPLLQA